MNNKEAVNWLTNVLADIGKVEHSDLWHYEQALTEIKDMLESAQLEERKESLCKKVRALCEESKIEFFFVGGGESTWSVTNNKHIKKIVECHKAQLSQEGTTKDTTSDAISRQAAIDVFNTDAELFRRALDNTDIVGVERAKYEWCIDLIELYIDDMKKLPPAQPKQSTGKWTLGFDNRYMEKYYYCSCCGCRKYEEHEPLDYFCSNCGAKMERRTDA